MLSREEIKESILKCANEHGRIVFDASPPAEAIELVHEGRLVRLSYRVFSLPEGG